MIGVYDGDQASNLLVLYKINGLTCAFPWYADENETDNSVILEAGFVGHDHSVSAAVIVRSAISVPPGQKKRGRLGPVSGFLGFQLHKQLLECNIPHI